MRFVTATEFAISEIKRLIVEQELPPDTRIDQTELATRLGLSRIPVRQALVQLAEHGFVQLSAHRSARVAPVSLDDLKQLYELRGRLEAWVLEEAIVAPPKEDIEYLEGLITSMRDARVAANLSEYMSLNREFHFSIFSMANNGHLIRTTKSLFDLSERYQWMYLNSQGMMEVSEHEHRDLIDAINAGKLDRTLAISAQHNQATREWVENCERDLGSNGGPIETTKREA